MRFSCVLFDVLFDVLFGVLFDLLFDALFDVLFDVLFPADARAVAYHKQVTSGRVLFSYFLVPFYFPSDDDV